MPAKVELDTLMREANEAAAMRSHRMGETRYGNFTRAFSSCVDCGMEITVIRNPAPNEIAIAGRAVALNCPEEGARA